MSQRSFRQRIIFIAKFDLKVLNLTFSKVIQTTPTTKYNSHLPIKLYRTSKFIAKYNSHLPIKLYRTSKFIAKDTLISPTKMLAEFRVIRPKLCGNCAFAQNSYTRKLVQITVFYTEIHDEDPSK